MKYRQHFRFVSESIVYKVAHTHTIMYFIFRRKFIHKRKRRRSDLVVTKAPTPTDQSKTTWQFKNATKKFDYTTIADRLKTVSWVNDSHLTDAVKPVYGIPTFPLTATTVKSKGCTFKNLYIILLIETEDQQPTKAESSVKCDTQTYIVKYMYIKNIQGHPIKLAVLCAVCTRAQVQRLKESWLIIKGDGDMDPVASEQV